ncbi:baseplate multidomain protein megatron [Hyphobacterium sp.]|uniref:baseplate multidomain protein megatron n=1 Tax=Hyphobacterium sp. TaxID=2004662 RepID=UPI003BAB0A49
MGQLVFGTLGKSVGQALLPNGLSAFGPNVSGQTLGGLAGAALGSVLDSALFRPGHIDGPRLDALPVQGSTEGAPIPLIYGRGRLAGQVIWASRYTEHRSSTGGGKGGPRVSNYKYSISFAVGICEGEIDGIGRIWANGELLDPKGVHFRLYRGEETQALDPLIETIEGSDNCPAFRGLAYIVFEDMGLDNFGNRVPNLSFEVFRSPQDTSGPDRLENKIRGVDLIPASGEFAYSTTPINEVLGPGRQRAININNARGASDFEVAIDDLERSLPNCKSVLIVSAWFGNDLRCGDCEIWPGTEARDKVTTPHTWSVAGEDRSTAYLISQIDGQPIYGGTPSDRSLIEAIRDLKSRGFSVSLYPFILMDIPAGNSRPDPYGASEQAAFPWRGRITCFPAAGEPGTVDGSQAAATQVDDFFGTASASDFVVDHESVAYAGPEDWRFRRFILHHAAIAAAAGGVDAFLIGTEMRGLTTIRGDGESFPAVDQFCDLANEVRLLVGPDTKLSYAADWSEYFGFQPADGSGNVYFHLDALWADPNIDAVAIDWYAPLSDWREGDDHLDAASIQTLHDLSYLSGNVEGGEGYDWYYANDSDRLSQVRTPISDSGYQKHWVYRYKDIRNWWSNPHFDRRAGLELTTASPWIPESKPVWFTEVGCPAIDKGSNQPNVFVDPKSSESFMPYFSGGSRDDLIQRRYIEAQLEYWAVESGNNPVSSVYGGSMIDPDYIHVWTWDARPFPDFPVRSGAWSDADNWRLGHWLNGRMGISPLEIIVRDIAERVGLVIDTSGIAGMVSGYVIDRPMSARDALSPLMAAFGFSLVDRAAGAVALQPGRAIPQVIDAENLTISDEAGSYVMTEADPSELPRDVRVFYQRDSADYRVSSLYARKETGDLEAVVDIQLPLLADESTASAWANDFLRNAHASTPQIRFTLAPSLISIEAGDCVQFDDHRMMINSRTGQDVAELNAAPFGELSYYLSGSTPDDAGGVLGPVTEPDLILIDMPLQPNETVDRDGPLAAVFADPWPGDISVFAGETPSSFIDRRTATQPAIIGMTATDLEQVQPGRWHRNNFVDVILEDESLTTRPPREVLDGANRVAVEGSGGWFTLQFERAELLAPRAYRLSGLLTDDAIQLGQALAPCRCVILDFAVGPLPLAPYEHSAELLFGAGPAGQPPTDAADTFVYQRRDLEPLAPVHLKARHKTADWQFSWIRRSRIGGDDWESADVLLDENEEKYLLGFYLDGVLIEARETETPSLEMSIDEFEAIMGSAPLTFEMKVQQISQRTGPGKLASLTVSAG